MKLPHLPAHLHGTVTPFAGNGRKLGYPTANIVTSTTLADGVYFGYADLAEYKRQPALIFIGTPTTMGDTDRRVEAHLLDIVDQDYYDQELIIALVHYHRSNHTFPSVQELIVVMRNDEIIARRWFRQHP